MANHDAGRGKRGLRDFRFLGKALGSVIVLMVALAFLVHMRVPIPHNSEVFTQDDWQAFADMYGAVAGTFFSAVAFAFLIYSSWMQREELVFQREQLEESREELKRQADATEASVNALSNQVTATRQTARLNGALALVEYTDRLVKEETRGMGKANPETEKNALDALKTLFDLMEEIEKHSD